MQYFKNVTVRQLDLKVSDIQSPFKIHEMWALLSFNLQIQSATKNLQSIGRKSGIAKQQSLKNADFPVKPISILAIFKVETMEVVSFYKVAKGFRLKGGETRITNLTVRDNKASGIQMRHYWEFTVQVCFGGNLRVGLKVSVVDGLNQLLGNFDNFLFAGWSTRP